MTLPGAGYPCKIAEVGKTVPHLLRILCRIPVVFVCRLGKQVNESGRRNLSLLSEFPQRAKNTIPCQIALSIGFYLNGRACDLNGYRSGEPIKPGRGLLCIPLIEPLFEKKYDGVTTWHLHYLHELQ